MGLFSKILGNDKESPAKLILMSCLMSSEIMLEKNQTSKGAVFEVLLLSSLYVLRKYKQKIPQEYSQFEREYFTELLKFVAKEGLLNQIPGDVKTFLNNRFNLYSQQLDSMHNNSEGNSLPSKIAYNFYEKPLSLNSGESHDLPALMIMGMKIKNLFQAIDESMESVLSNKFDSKKQTKEKYSEENVTSILAYNQKLIFDVVCQTKEYFGLTGIKKQYADEYLKYVCFITSGAILNYKLYKQGYADNTEESKRVFRAVYSNMLSFCKKYVSSKIIKFPIFKTIDEETIILLTSIKLKEYTNDIKHFFETGEPCHIEEINDDDDVGTYKKKIQYRFIQETHEIEFKDDINGISLEFHFNDFLDEYNTEEGISKTLSSIGTLSI